MKKSFAPQVIIRVPDNPGNPRSMVTEYTVTPEGWMWILGFALCGCEWAIKKALDPEFDMDTKVRRYELRRRLYFRREHLEALEVRVKNVRLEVEETARNLNILGDKSDGSTQPDAR